MNNEEKKTYEENLVNLQEDIQKDAEEVKVETTFDELDADSLDVFQVISEIEDEFDIQIDRKSVV